MLCCPHCGGDLTQTPAPGTALRCPNRHVFDVARQGYVSLLPGNAHTGTGDTAAMVAARTAFLGAGHYDPIAECLAAESARALAAPAVDAAAAAGGVVDVGAGTGHYLARVLDRLPDRVGLALDVSKYALRRAARAHPRAGAAVCDTWRSLPVRTGAAALALNVFAPRNGAEIHRVLRPGGVLLVVAPNPNHLTELVSTLGLLSVAENKRDRLDATLLPHFTPLDRRTVEFTMSLARHDVEALAGMGPSARHTSAEELRERVAGLAERTAVTASVSVAAYRA